MPPLGEGRMITRIATMAAVLSALCTAATPAAHADENTNLDVLTCGQVVTGYAVLTQDLACTGNGIVVGASGPTIDLNGFTIRGDRGDFGILVGEGEDDVTVTNGVVRNFETGIRGVGILGLNGADRFSVVNVVVSGNAQDGIWIVGESDSVTSSTAAGNFSIGVDLGEGRGARVDSTVATGNGLAGIAVGDEGQVTSSIASGNGGIGIGAFADSVSIGFSTASGNGFSGGPGSAGISVRGDGASIEGNRADGNGLEAGLDSDLQGFGIQVDNYTIPPVGTNSARGNDDPAECSPAFLC